MPRIALVVLDTLRKDAFDEHFQWLPGTRFENAWSTSHYTVPVHGSMFTGKYPSESGVHARSESFDCPDSVLPELLAQNGYTTWAVHTNPLLEASGFDRGFVQEISGHECDLAAITADICGWDGEPDTLPQLFNWRKATREAKTDSQLRRYLSAFGRCLRDPTTPTLPSLRAGLQLISEDDSDKGGESIQTIVEEMSFSDDEFLFLNVMEAHTPYDPPQRYRTIDLSQYDTDPQTPFKSDVDFDALRQAYDDCVRYLSEIYQQIFETLRKEFDVVLTVSDHGELLDEHDIWAHWYGVYPELVHVPLVVWQADGDSSVRQDPVSLLDVYQTICDAAGVDSTADSRGKSLLDPPSKRTYLVESHGLREEDRERMVDCGMADAEVERYDREFRGIVTPPDYYGFETDSGFVEQGSPSLNDPQGEIERQLSALDIRDSDDESHENISEDMRERLEDMGYL